MISLEIISLNMTRNSNQNFFIYYLFKEKDLRISDLHVFIECNSINKKELK